MHFPPMKSGLYIKVENILRELRRFLQQFPYLISSTYELVPLPRQLNELYEKACHKIMIPIGSNNDYTVGQAIQSHIPVKQQIVAVDHNSNSKCVLNLSLFNHNQV